MIDGGGGGRAALVFRDNELKRQVLHVLSIPSLCIETYASYHYRESFCDLHC
jgi:hypothetical protein